MAIQPIGTVTEAFLSPTINGDAAMRRNNTQASEEVTLPVATQTPQAVTQSRPIDSTSSAAANKENLEKHLSKINDFVQTRASNIQFTMDEETGIRIVKVVDTATKEVIRQLPTEEAVRIAKALDQLQGLLIRQKA